MVNYVNYKNGIKKDVNNIIFKNTIENDIFWTILLLLPALLVLICCIVGIWYDGWLHLGLVFYLFYICVNAWQRQRIRLLYNIEGNNTCDIEYVNNDRNSMQMDLDNLQE